MSIADSNFNYTPPAVYTAEALYVNDKYGIFKSYFLPYLQGVTEIPLGKYDKWWGKTPAGNSAIVANFARVGYCTNNGICYRMVSHGTNYFYIIVDLNGSSGPNIVGKDIFYFALHFKDDELVIDGYVYQVYKHTSNAQLLQWCGKNGSNWDAGKSCTELIMRNGWKIPDDYPLH